MELSRWENHKFISIYRSRSGVYKAHYSSGLNVFFNMDSAWRKQILGINLSVSLANLFPQLYGTGSEFTEMDTWFSDTKRAVANTKTRYKLE